MAEFEALGVEVTLLKLERSVGSLRLLCVLCRVFRRVAANIIHIQYMAPGFVATLAARLSGCPLIIATVHQPWTPKHHGVKAKILLLGASRLCSKFTCVSQAVEQSWFGSAHVYSAAEVSAGGLQTGASRHCTIHNAINLAQVDKLLSTSKHLTLRKQLELNDRIVVGTVARLSREKGVDTLLVAFDLVRKMLTAECAQVEDKSQRNLERCSASGNGSINICLLIIGDGQEREQLEAQSRNLMLVSEDLRSLALEDRSEACMSRSDVLWFGRRTWEESIQLVSLMDICVTPSRFEGFGLSAAEGMACGRAVVASDVGGLPEVVGTDGSTGMLFAPEDPQALALRLFDLIHSKEKRRTMGCAGRNRVASLFGSLQLRESIRSLYGIPNAVNACKGKSELQTG